MLPFVVYATGSLLFFFGTLIGVIGVGEIRLVDILYMQGSLAFFIGSVISMYRRKRG